MGLRDRGFVIDYYIPLFAGVDAAKRDRWRTRFLWGSFAPYYSGGGTGTPGGICGGDGGCDTPSDFSIQTPTITYPDDSEHLDLSVCSTITSDAFVSDNGQTHVASRWMIELMNSGPGELYDCTQYQVLNDPTWWNSMTAAMAGASGIAEAPACTGDPFSIYGKSVASIGPAATDYVAMNAYCGSGTVLGPAGSTRTAATRSGMYCSSAMVPTTPTGVYVYDSGPGAIHLTSLPLSDIIVPGDNAYRVTVRYKGSNGGWSDWAIYQAFTLGPCEACS